MYLYTSTDSMVSCTERVLHLEADLRRSEETIQSLQQELAITKLAQTPTTDTHRYQLGVGPRGQGSSGQGGGQGSLSGQPKSVEEVAVIVTETSVAKGTRMILLCRDKKSLCPKCGLK